MAKSKKHGSRVHEDKYATKAQSAQAGPDGPEAVTKRWQSRQRDMDKAARGKALTGNALAESGACTCCNLQKWECDLIKQAEVAPIPARERLRLAAIAGTAAEPSPERIRQRQAFDDLRDYEDRVFGPTCGFCGELESICSPTEAHECFVKKMSMNDPATITV